MRTLGHVWSARGPFEDVEIELYPESIDGAARDVSLRELGHLLWMFKCGDPEARRAVLAVCGRLRACGPLDGAASRSAEAIAEELLAAARAGFIVARRRERRAVVLRLDSAAENVLGPADTAAKHVYTVCVFDDTGAPVAGAKVSVDIAGDKEEKTTDGSGKVTVERPEAGSATVVVTNLDDLREKLWTQWARPVGERGKPAGDRVVQAVVTQPIEPLAAPSDWVVTLVLTRPPIWRVRMVGMVFDADKCFLLPQALDGIRTVVAMHEAHPAAKVLIVGHEGGDEATGGVDLALTRAKTLAAYLTNKPEEWLSWFGPDKSPRQRWGVREVQLMLSALPGADGRPLYDGGSSGILDERTTASLKAFQQSSGLPVDAKAGPATRTALVKRYMGLEDTSLAADVKAVSHGCTGHDDDTITADGLQPDDRRLEVLFFDAEIRPPPAGETSDAGSAEYPAWRARLVETADFENHGIHAQIVDTQKQPVPMATVHLEGPAPQDAVADEHGFVTFWGLVAGDYTVRGVSRTGIAIPATKITYPTAKTILGARAMPGAGNVGTAA
jgi:hypothetical protein